jgi:acyl-homoserine-lactone acylase
MGIGRLHRGEAARRACALAAAAGSSVALMLAGAGPAAAQETTLSAAGSAGDLQATISRDSHGIPNIEGRNFADVGFGYGYAFAEDNICEIAESYVTVSAERSRYFGPDNGYRQGGNGFAANNLNSDFFYQRIIDDHTVEKLLDQPPPAGPVDEIKEGVTGYVAGYNKYLADTGVDKISDPRCRGAAWVRPITELDAYRRFYQLAMLASQTIAIDGIAGEKTPGLATGLAIDPGAIASGLQQNLKLPIGSNAIALGSQATAGGSGMLLGNPHFPWDGAERFYQAHLTIPGRVNVSGGSLYGVPLILIGHTDNLAWSHTVSTAYRFTPFQETINPVNPRQYLYDGEWKEMKQDQVAVEVGPGDTRTRTLYSTSHGPVLDSLVGIPLPWTPATAFSMGDVNATNFRYLNHFFFTNQAQSVDELDRIEKRYQGVPWVNTIAADSSGKAYYADIGAIPNVSDEKARTCDSVVGVVTFSLLGLPMLDGSRSACEWGNDDDAVAPGIFGPSHLPSLKRDDYVTNSNDSYWLSNPAEPLEGYARIIGDERTPRTLRTRLGLRIVQQRLDGSDGLPGAGFTRQQLQDAVFNNRQMAGELWRDDLVGLCESAPGGLLIGTGGPVDVSPACPVLAAWDVHDNLDSNGAILFRRFASHAFGSGVPLVSLPTGDLTLFSTPFDVNDPVNTPAGLNVVSPTVQAALADAVTDLNDAGIPLDAPLRGYQYEKRGDERIPIHGGPGDPNGDFNAISAPWVGSGPEPGFPNVVHGSSFVMVTSFGGGCPDDRSILTYSQSENPNSPHFADQTRMFSRKEWVDPLFCQSEIDGNPDLTTTTIQGCLGGPCPATAGGPDATPPQSSPPQGKKGKKAKKPRKCKRQKRGAKQKHCKSKRR